VLELAAAAPEWLRWMILVSAFTGLRLFEAAEIRPEDVVHRDGTWFVIVRHGKGGYRDEESVIFEPALSMLLERLRVTEPGRRLMTTSRGTLITRQYVAKHFAPLARRVGYTTGTFHAMRHFHACWLLDAGGGADRRGGAAPAA
jgi:integrase